MGLLLALALAALVPLAGQAALNARTFRRLPPAPPGTPAAGASVLVPARDEEARIGPLLASFQALDPAEAAELVVYDDASRDGTAALVTAAAARDPRIRLIRGEGPPPGWAGKVHALHRLAEAARPEATLLLFVDADVELRPGGVARAAAALAADGLDVLSLYPDQVLGTAAERLGVPMMVMYFYWLAPQWLLARGARAPVAPLNGQFMLWRRERLAAIGGWSAIRDAWLDDMTMGRRLAAHGFRARYRAGAGAARCRMYTGFGEMWRGFGKHAFDSMGLAPAGYVAVLAWLALALLAPWLVAAAWLGGWAAGGPPPAPAEAWLLAWALGLGLATRFLAAAQAGHGWTSALLHPAAMALALANGLWSLVLARRRAATWKGRTAPAALPATPDDPPGSP